MHLERILQQTGVKPEEVLFVGDGWTDYKTALSAGTRFVFLTEMSDWADAPEKMVEAPADFTVVDSWQEVLDRVVVADAAD